MHEGREKKPNQTVGCGTPRSRALSLFLFRPNTRPTEGPDPAACCAGRGRTAGAAMGGSCALDAHSGVYGHAPMMTKTSSSSLAQPRFLCASSSSRHTHNKVVVPKLSVPKPSSRSSATIATTNKWSHAACPIPGRSRGGSIDRAGSKPRSSCARASKASLEFRVLAENGSRRTPPEILLRRGLERRGWWWLGRVVGRCPAKLPLPAVWIDLSRPPHKRLNLSHQIETGHYKQPALRASPIPAGGPLAISRSIHPTKAPAPPLRRPSW